MAGGWKDDPVPYDAISAPEQLQALLDAVLVVETDLDLPSTLRRVVEAACSLTGARYGALELLDASGHGLYQFVHVGIDAATVDAIGHRPEGAGILGTLILDPEPLRLTGLRAGSGGVS